MSIEFLNYGGDDSQQVVDNKHQRYHQYLLDNQAKFPEAAYEFAIADWHYDPSDHRCPHDSWVESLEIIESDLPDSDHDRLIDIRVRLLGAYHDGKIELRYEKVRRYDLRYSPDASYRRSKWHGDWIIDEFRLSEGGRVIHSVRFWLEGYWTIECDDVIFSWLPH